MSEEVFHYRGGELSAAGVSLLEAARSFETPFYVYDRDALVERYRALDASFTGIDHLHCVALKANSQAALIEPLVREGAGAEVVSGGELALALALGFEPSRIVFSGVGKTERGLVSGLRAGIRMFLVESETELSVLDDLAKREGSRARVALRLNPNIDPGTHPHIATGISTAKFGLDLDEARRVYGRHREFASLDFVGVHSHIGSQITALEPLSENARMLARWVAALEEVGLSIRDVDIGGGLGIDYEGGSAPNFDAYASRVLFPFAELGVTLITEPGRALLGPVGALVVRVLYVKEVHGRRFVVVDAGLNDLLRPALYGAYHRVVPVQKRRGAAVTADIAGAVCESSDIFARDRALIAPERGDYLAILDTGAYGFVMTSNYNLRPRPAELVVSGKELRLVRPAESEAELVARELGRKPDSSGASP